ncbi:MAG: Uncharacterized protein G01um10147_315 [Microgenomates group bacterium Gr01-1014_7]|nr:MAG: Uncharacterized protein G01um10147_315 [Microgenomates group bacterium Gr01-1014_7]
MEVIITPKAQKQLKHLSSAAYMKIKKKLLMVKQEPYSGKKLEGELSELRVLRAWPYRILYYINLQDQNIYITSILHRQGAYK